MTTTKGKIGVLIEEHFDGTEYRWFNEYFPAQGYEVDYISHLWGQPELKFGSNPENDQVEYHVTVTTEVNDINHEDYKGIIAIGAYATDRLRYQATVKKGEKNQAPAVVFLRKAAAIKGLSWELFVIVCGYFVPILICSRARKLPVPTTLFVMWKMLGRRWFMTGIKPQSLSLMVI